ncbi:tyrosine-type recombinase/integrase [Cohnella cholangitidis]|uniref:Tyrosine-type recombinase/integrase n=1 Tax=Cohnella cholangitidis TaxID=2598458 RepID=A0A7G5C3E6_9BACL|nr:tyrosine-type recombinase/integrase [Cohnella cholangitidis]QMV43730.1 tyrosine-type recombinase/integrase [Cohnella cholangitidis]
MKVVQPIRDPDIIADIKVWLKERNERNHILFLTGVDTGLRISDVLKLRVHDVTGTHIAIREGKTGKQKLILISPELKRELKPYISGKSGHEFLFKSRQGRNQPIGRSMAYKILRQVAEEFRLDHIGCHTLRKTFGRTLYFLSGKDVAMVQNFFGHVSQQDTLRYIGESQETLDNLLKRYKSS